ncbi:MAG: fused MFS/spermidine synthase [Planctomycetes bacterium]|nr:fused MFS/spermidine synthase [Planctomycetota bacterium]
MNPDPAPVPPLQAGGRALLLAVVLLSGAAVMVLEVSAGRLLAPWFGMSLPVWTNVLAVVLGALAAGYALGGRLAARGADQRTMGVLLAAGGLLAAGAAWAGPRLAPALLPQGANLEGLAAILVKGSLLATLLLFGPPMVLLGTVGPLAVHLLAPGRDAGKAAGWVLSLSTVGSIAGTFLTTYVLLPGIGTRATVGGSGAVLAAAGLLLAAAGAGRGRAAAAAGGAALLSAILAVLASAGEFRPAGPGEGRILLEDDGAYQFVQVREVMDAGAGGTPVPTRLLNLNEGVATYHSVLKPGSVLTGGRYYDLYPVLPLLCGARPGKPLDVLVLGLAAGTQARALHHFLGGDRPFRLDGVEIDPAVIRAGRERFELPADAPWLRVHAMDARPFLEAAPPDLRWDLVLVDCYSQEYYIPFHLSTREFFTRLKGRLKPGGILAYNAFAYRSDDPLLAGLVNTTAQVFGRAWRIPVEGYPNFLVLASNREGDLPLLGFAADAAEAARGRSPGGEPLSLFAGRPEGREALRLAARALPGAILRLPEDGLPVFTDDLAPVERLMDGSIRRYDRERTGGR